MLSRRHFLLSSAALLAAHRGLLAESAPIAITVYKDPGCECCAHWVKHLTANGFAVAVRDVSNVDEVKQTMGVPPSLQSCHTGVTGRYVIEGHVPADVIKKFLGERSASLGLAVPGMPVGSPGMEGGRPERYNVMVFDRNGKARVYAAR